MKTNSLTPRMLGTICAFTLLAVSALTGLVNPAHAGTISGMTSTWNGVSTTTNPPKITVPGQIIQVKYEMGVLYLGPDKNPNWTCWAKLEYSDGTPFEMVPIKYPVTTVSRMKQYAKHDTYTATLTGTPHNLQPGCLGSSSKTMTIEDGLAPSPKVAAGNNSAAVVPQAAAQIQQGQQLLNNKPKLTKLILAQTEVSPGVVELTANVQSNGPSEPCSFNVTVMTSISGSDAINTAVVGPLKYTFALPAAAQKFPLGNIPATGKYRLVVDAATSANATCIGSASADFEVKRAKFSIAANITGVKLVNDGYDKTNKFWMVGVDGKSDAPCGYVIRLKHEATGKTIETTGTSTLPMSQAIAFDQEPAPGQYLATVGPWTPVPVSDVPACMVGIKSASAHHTGPKLGAFNFMTIDFSTVSITAPLGNNSFDGDSTLGGLSMPTAISMDVHTINQPANGQNCAYTLTVAKDGVQKAMAYNTGQPVDVLAAIKQGPGWGKGEYTISAHSTPLNSGSALPSCLGKRTHKLTVVDGGAIASGINSLTHNMNCSDRTWDSKNLFSANEKYICVVTIKPKITGGVCNYTIQVQEPGAAPTYYNKVHYVEGGDLLSFEMYRGIHDQAMADTLNAKRYVVRVFASAQDKASGSGCVGEYYDANVQLFLK